MPKTVLDQILQSTSQWSPCQPTHEHFLRLQEMKRVNLLKQNDKKIKLN